MSGFYCHVDILHGALARRVKHARVAVHLLALDPESGIKFGKAVAVMVMRIRIIQSCAHGGGSSPFRLCGEPLLNIAPYGPWNGSIRNAASFFAPPAPKGETILDTKHVAFRVFRGREIFVRGVMHQIFKCARRGENKLISGCLDGLADLESHGAPSLCRSGIE